MNLSEAEKRMIYQVEGTSQGAALNEIYMTWRYAPDKAMKDTAEGLLKKLRPFSDKECMDVIRDVQKNYRLPGKARTIRMRKCRKYITGRCLRNFPRNIWREKKNSGRLLCGRIPGTYRMKISVLSGTMWSGFLKRMLCAV